jgi:ribosomal protein L11 methyltransferase
MPWIALTLEVDTAEAEAFSEGLLEAGAQSVSTSDPDLPQVSVTALLAADDDPGEVIARLVEFLQLPAAPKHSVSRVEDDDWVRRSQAQFQPIEIGGRLWVGPSWHTPPAQFPLAIRLDPGLAFGTGSHPTTRLVLEFLARTVRGGERVLDYGCGSGILAIAAAKLGAAHVEATDIDPQALQTGLENARENGVTLYVSAPDRLQSRPHDIVVANILAVPLIVLAPLLAERTAQGGRIALSGILQSQAEEVIEAYRPWFKVGAAEFEEGWALVEGERK